MRAFVAARAVEGFVLCGVPHVEGAPGELLLQFPASDAAEFSAKAFGQFLRLLEVVHVAAFVQIVAVAAVFRAQCKQSAAQRAAHAFAYQAAAPGKTIISEK